jgi:hypothetical protein
MKPIRIFYSELSERFYASRHYTIKGNVAVLNGQKDDVTDQIGALIDKYDIEFKKATAE